MNEGPTERDKYGGAGHTHVTRDIKPEGWGCPACDQYHQGARARGEVPEE